MSSALVALGPKQTLSRNFLIAGQRADLKTLALEIAVDGGYY
jgi:hypothetical protein